MDLESSQNGDTGAKKSSMSSRKRQAASIKTGNGINNVAFEDEKGNDRKARKEDGSTEESNHDFNRDSIYRFAVNPLLSGPTDVVEEGEHQTRVDSQRLPFRNTLYLPSSTCEYLNTSTVLCAPSCLQVLIRYAERSHKGNTPLFVAYNSSLIVFNI